MGKGFLHWLFSRTKQHSTDPASDETSGKPDPYEAAGMAFGVNDDVSDSDMAELGTVLGAAGAFDDNDDDNDDDDDDFDDDFDDDDDSDDDGFDDDD